MIIVIANTVNTIPRTGNLSEKKQKKKFFGLSVKVMFHKLFLPSTKIHAVLDQLDDLTILINHTAKMSSMSVLCK